METVNTLLLKRGDVADLLTIEECIASVEHAFKLYAEGKAMPPKILGIHTDGGGFHIKAGVLGLSRPYFVAKINANFPGNSTRFGLPTIQGVIVVCDGINGRLLALIDSIEITIIRTGAATAVAAKYLALPGLSVVTICGCGNQGRISLKALMKVRPVEKVYAFDIDQKQAQKFSVEFSGVLQVIPIGIEDLSMALRESRICITCTPSQQPYIYAGDIMPGTFISAVGADSEEKQELHSDVLSSCKIVVDIPDQCASIGEVHHAIEQQKIALSDIHADLGSVIAGMKPGRESSEEIIVFDSTGMALQDVAASAIVYEKAIKNGTGMTMDFAGAGNDRNG